MLSGADEDNVKGLAPGHQKVPSEVAHRLCFVARAQVISDYLENAQLAEVVTIAWAAEEPRRRESSR